MIDQNRVYEIIEERKKLHPDDPHIIEIWGELTSIFSENENNTIKFLTNCNKEYLVWIGEVFDEISEHLQSMRFLQCLENLNKKYPELCLEIDIMYAEKSFKIKK